MINRFTCPKCDISYSTKSNLNRHVLSYCIDKNKDYKISAKNSKKSSIMIKHFPCSKCDITFISSIDLNKHICEFYISKSSIGVKCSKNIQYHPKINHDIPLEESSGDDRLECEYCNKLFTLRYSLKRHLDNRCKIKKRLNENERINNDREQIYQKLIINMEKMQSHINILQKEKNQMIPKTNKSHCTNVNINTNSNNTTNNVTNNITNIQLVGYSKENNQSLTDNEIFKLMCSSELVRLQLSEQGKSSRSCSNKSYPF
jgi:uncharacterized C2H2 Zn-finger protein